MSISVSQKNARWSVPDTETARFRPNASAAFRWAYPLSCPAITPAAMAALLLAASLCLAGAQQLENLAPLGFVAQQRQATLKRLFGIVVAALPGIELS